METKTTRSSEQQKAPSKLICPFCRNECLSSAFQDHVKKCKECFSQCPKCFSFQAPEKFKDHLRECDRVKVLCFCEQSIPKSDLKTHQKHYCQSFKNFKLSEIGRSVTHCLACDEKLDGSNFKYHFQRCVGSFCVCRICYRSIPATRIAIHEQLCHEMFKIYHDKSMSTSQSNNINSESVIQCVFCKDSLHFKSLRYHYSECKSRYVFCEICFEYFPLSNPSICQSCLKPCRFCNRLLSPFILESHTEYFHPESTYVSKEKRESSIRSGDTPPLIPCPLCKMSFSQTNSDHSIDSHLNTCVHRPINCRFCNQPFIHLNIEVHMSVCPERTEKCLTCGQSYHPVNSTHTCSQCLHSTSEKSLETNEGKTQPRIMIDSKPPGSTENDRTPTSQTLSVSDSQNPSSHSVSNRQRVESASQVSESKNYLNPPVKSQTRYCKLCYDEVQLGSLLKHLESCLKLKMVCQHCKRTFKKQSTHGDDSSIPRISEHEKHCNMQNVVCGKCDGGYVKKDVEDHKKICPSETIKCSLCSDETKRKDLPQHLPICSYLSILRPHCSKPYSKRNKRLDRHEGECPSRLVLCELCNQPVEFCKLKLHLDECPEKEISCRLCKAQLRRKHLIDHLKVCNSLKISCQFCMEVFPRKKQYGTFRNTSGLDDHLTDCEFADRKCQFCENMIPFAKQKDHKDECLMVTIKCSLCEKTTLRKDLPSHLPECDKLNRVCDWCGLLVTDVIYLSHFYICDGYFVSCVNKCGGNYILKHENAHLENCPKQEIRCRLCKNRMTRESFFSHFETCSKLLRICRVCSCLHISNNPVSDLNSCSKLEELCLHCSRPVKSDQIDRHIIDCDYQTKNCPICSNPVYRKDELEHPEICPEEAVKCEHCPESIARKNFASHDQTCPEKKITCECQEIILQKNKELHKHECVNREVECPLGCEKKIRVVDFPLHSESEDFFQPHLEYFLHAEPETIR